MIAVGNLLQLGLTQYYTLNHPLHSRRHLHNNFTHGFENTMTKDTMEETDSSKLLASQSPMLEYGWHQYTTNYLSHPYNIIMGLQLLNIYTVRKIPIH